MDLVSNTLTLAYVFKVNYYYAHIKCISFSNHISDTYEYEENDKLYIIRSWGRMEWKLSSHVFCLNNKTKTDPH